MKNPFDGINQSNKVKLLKLLESSTFTYQKGVYITNLFQRHNFIGIVLEGYLEIIKNDFEGNKRFVEGLEINGIFGTILSGINSGDYEILVVEESRIAVIDYSNMINVDDNKYNYYNIFIKNLLEIYNQAIDEKNERIEILVQKSIRNKLLEYFRITSKKNGSKYIYLPSTFNNLADYLAIDRSAMSRELKNLKEEGFIEIKNKRITLKY